MNARYVLFVSLAALSVQTARSQISPGTEVFFRAKADCGLSMNGSTDDYAALVACIPSGGNVVIAFPPGTVRLSQQLVITQNNVALVGAGGLAYRSWQGTPTQNSTRFLYTGGSTTNSVIRIDGSGNSPRQVNYFRLEGITVDGNNNAGHAVTFQDAFNPVVKNVAMIRWANQGDNAYGFVIKSDGVANCLQAGASDIDSLYIGTGNAATGGILIGPDAFSSEACTIKMGKIWLDASNTPGYHQIWVKNGDSNTFDNVSAEGNAVGAANITNITTDGSGVATVYCSAGCGMPSGITNLRRHAKLTQ